MLPIPTKHIGIDIYQETNEPFGHIYVIADDNTVYDCFNRFPTDEEIDKSINQ